MTNLGIGPVLLVNAQPRPKLVDIAFKAVDMAA